MQMREKHSSHARRVDVQPGQAGRQAPTGIEKKHLVTGDHQRADTEAFTAERRSTHRAEKNRSEEHTSELQSLRHLVCRLLLEKKYTSHIASANLRSTP